MKRVMSQINPSSTSHRLAQAIAADIAANRTAADGRAVRRDGWTPERIRLFIETLAGCGSITAAARAAGVSERAAYKFRDRAPTFDDAWQIALDIARPIRPFVSRVLHGSVDITLRDGVVWERHYFDNRLARAVLTGLDRQIASFQGKGVPVLAEDFESLVERACAEASARGARMRGKRPLREHSDGVREDRDAQPSASVTASTAAEPSRAGTGAIARGMCPCRELKALRRSGRHAGPTALHRTRAAVLREEDGSANWRPGRPVFGRGIPSTRITRPPGKGRRDSRVVAFRRALEGFRAETRRRRGADEGKAAPLGEGRPALPAGAVQPVPPS